jgi:serine/threonine protein kinase
MSQFVQRKTIGRGGFSTVHSCIHSATRTPVALKTLLKANSSRCDGFVVREQWCLYNLEHPNIIHTVHEVAETLGLNSGTFKSADGSVIMIQECANRGDLFDFVKKSGFVKESVARDIFVQIFNALLYLHNNGIAHMDIKVDNVLLHETSTELQVKLADFGLCKFSKHFGDDVENVMDRCGTKQYMSPEMHLTTKPFDGKKADLWSAGAILFILLTGLPPMVVIKPECTYFSLINAGQYNLFWENVDHRLEQMGHPIPS